MGDSHETTHWTDPDCPVARTADLIGDRWSMLIIRDAMDGARSFTDFQQRTGIARNILSDRLRRLSSSGLIERVNAPSGKRQHYALTAAGEDLFPVVLAFRTWGERHAFTKEETHSLLVDDSGHPVTATTPTGTDGTPLSSHNTHVIHVDDSTTRQPSAEPTERHTVRRPQ